jgi:hypothetical protein
MKPNVCAILAFLSLLVLVSPRSTTGQVRFKIPIAYADSVFLGGDNPTDTTGLSFLFINRDTLWFGAHDLATICRDTLAGFTTHWSLADTGTFFEELQPPSPPSGREVKFITIDSRQGCFTDGSKMDIRGFTGGLLRDSTRFKQGADNNPVYFHREVLRWPTTLGLYYDSCRLRNLGSTAVNVDMRQEFKATSLLFNASLLASHNFKILFSNPKSVPPIPVVTLLTPSDAAIDVSLSPSLTWSAASGALYYRIQVSKADANFGQVNLIADDSVGAGATSKSLINLTGTTVYYWRVAVFTAGGVSYFQDPPYSFTTQGSTGVRDRDHRGPEGFLLYQNYPDPFNPSTTIRYSLPAQAHVRLAVFTLLGKEVETLVNALQQPGMNSVEFRAHDLPSGTYIYRLNAGGFTDVKRMVLVR